MTRANTDPQATNHAYDHNSEADAINELEATWASGVGLPKNPDGATGDALRVKTVGPLTVEWKAVREVPEVASASSGEVVTKTNGLSGDKGTYDWAPPGTVEASVVRPEDQTEWRFAAKVQDVDFISNSSPGFVWLTYKSAT